jgi:hypothetical protein
MSNLTSGQKWVIVAFVASLLTLATTFFLPGEIKTFAYIVISMGVAAYAVLGKEKSSKPKKDI